MRIKKELGLFIIFLLIIPFITSLEIKLSKDSYQPRETLIAEVNGNFISLNLNNFLIYKGNKVHSEPIISGFTNQNRVYYFYALLPNTEGNYSLRIENSEYLLSGEIKKEVLIKNFNITKTNQSSLSINPGFIFTNKDFSIKIKALNENQNIPLSFENYSSNISIFEESEEEVSFSIANIPTKKTFLKIGNYIIPVFIVNNLTQNTTGLISQLYFSADNITALVYPEKAYIFNFYLENAGQTNITNITLTSDLNANLNPSKIDLLKLDETKPINLTIIIPKDKKNLSGKIIAKYNNDSEYLPIYLEVAENNSKTALPGINNTGSLSCKNIGKICLSDEECKGQITPSLEGACCIGECAKKKQESSNWIYGLIALIIVVIIAIAVLIQYRKRQNIRPKSIDEMMREKVDLKKMNAKKNHEEDF